MSLSWGKVHAGGSKHPKTPECRASLGPAGFAQPHCPWLWCLGLLMPDFPWILGRWV